MKRRRCFFCNHSRLKWILLSLLVTTFLSGCSNPEKTYQAIEISGNLVGYSETASYFDGNSRNLKKTETRTFMMLTLLGQPFNMEIREVCLFDPDSEKMTYYDADVRAGQMHTGSTLIREGDQLKYVPKAGGIPKTIPIEPGVQTDEYHLIQQFVSDLGPEGQKEKTYRIVDSTRGRIAERVYTFIGDEQTVIEGVAYNSRLYNWKDLSLGVSGRIWVDPSNNQIIRSHQSDDTSSYMTDAGVRSRIQRVSIDERILGKVDTQIQDFRSLSYMKVKAEVRSAGEVISTEALNVPGQRFEGTVTDNIIEGVFEIEHQLYDGKNAPPFPPDFGPDENLRPFLEPELLIESDDPVLIKKAKELTAGSADSWEAVKRLSRWVGTQIAGAIPGGSARQTYDNRKGECGAHSRLFTAFCRAVGIPSRMVMGGVYFEDSGGAFGQHGWNEVYMGEAGWIPLDTTFQEFDYIDSGHIRLGYLTSFQPVKLEVLDYKTGTRDR